MRKRDEAQKGRLVQTSGRDELGDEEPKWYICDDGWRARRGCQDRPTLRVGCRWVPRMLRADSRGVSAPRVISSLLEVEHSARNRPQYAGPGVGIGVVHHRAPSESSSFGERPRRSYRVAGRVDESKEWYTESPLRRFQRLTKASELNVARWRSSRASDISHRGSEKESKSRGQVEACSQRRLRHSQRVRPSTRLTSSTLDPRPSDLPSPPNDPQDHRDPQEAQTTRWLRLLGCPDSSERLNSPPTLPSSLLNSTKPPNLLTLATAKTETSWRARRPTLRSSHHLKPNRMPLCRSVAALKLE